MLLHRELNEAFREGVRLGFESNAYEHCDGADDPDDRCPSDGACVCVYMRWKSLPWWKRVFLEAPPRPSEKTCRTMVFKRMVDQALDNLRAERHMKRVRNVR